VIVSREIDIGGRPLKVIVGKTARQADGAAWVQYGDTVLHVAAVSNREPREGMDFLPLFVDYREKYFAAGKIPGGFFKREGRPHEKEILSARMIDRPIRPLFPEGYAYETQVMAIVLSADRENDADVLGPIGASIALNVSDIPMNQIIASVRVGLIDGRFIVNPTFAELEKSRLNLIVVGSEAAITMVEGHAREVSNQELNDALFFGHDYIKRIVAFEHEIIEGIRRPTRDYIIPERDKELEASVERMGSAEVREIARLTDKSERRERTGALIERMSAELGEDDPQRISFIKSEFMELMKHEVRRNILRENRRIDGRQDTDIRSIDCEVGLLPRVHGSALFTRGQTQALATATLGTKMDEQRIDNIDAEGFKKYMLHYNFPPYSTGEIKTYFGVSRREIGHGKLGERAIEAVLPEWDDFPYTIRVVSDILESNGSSSMATVCAGSLALMDAGVPIRKAVAGIAMGMVMEGEKYRILTDILGDEDHLGDMDFKIAGTRDGITAFQMDIKIAGISAELMAEALTRARDVRHQILDIMDRAINRPRPDISRFAPKLLTLKIPIERIGALIGPGGKIIREIIAETGASIDVEDDGTVRIGAVDGVSGEKARQRVEELTAVPEVGKDYEGTIKRIMDFGAFVEIMPGIEGLMHISQIDRQRVESVYDYFKVGDKVTVKLLKVEPDGKLDLSRKALLPNDHGSYGDGSSNRPPRHGGETGRPGGHPTGRRNRR